MTPRPSSPLRPGCRSAALLALALLAPVLAAMPPGPRPSLAERFRAALFPAADPGYIPLVGSPPLSFAPERPATPAIQPPPVALYAPRPPAAAPTTTAPVVTATPDPVPAPQASTVQQPVQVKPEDVLPYFQLDDGSGRTADALHFTPALPSSRADYRQQ